ncbi:MAG: hypothetical protein HY931_00890 [Candidatus Falkowbacteria bacterium]|nr:MAG: hypothetical protein HY931_00890 [Candidatus Falkowbacteria bacterium]
MEGIEKSHCNAVLGAISKSTYAFWQSTVEEALRPILKYGKSDTLGMDAMAEITIIETLQEYDHLSAIITEEAGGREKIRFSHPEDHHLFRTVFISDPTDRSSQIKAALESTPDKTKSVLETVNNQEFKEMWEAKFGTPLPITGGSSAITCVRKGLPIFSVIVNYITRQLFLACSAGCYSYELPIEQTKLDLETILTNGENIFFHDTCRSDHMRHFTTFMGKSTYKENFIASHFMSEADMIKNLRYDLPGGPSRALYLSKLQPLENQIGFVFANGEKITEWIHWLPYLRFARKKDDQGEPALKLFEVYQDQPYTKEGILMSTPPAYSIFQPVNGSDRMVIGVNKFAAFANPSKIRSTLILTLADNHWATRAVNQYGYRPIEFFSE